MLSHVIRQASATGLVALGLVVSGSTDATPTPAQTPKGPPPPTQHFRSRPGLTPPPVQIHTAAHSTARGYIFLGAKAKVVQAGPMIVDNRGQLVWFNPLDTHGVADVKVQRYRGKPVITWWRGRAPMGVGSGYYAIYDNRYRVIARVRAGHGYAGDIHEFVITRRNTALFTIYHQLHVDLTSIGGPKEGRIFDGIVQEVAIPSGKVLFEWHSWPTIGLDESYAPPPDKDKGAKAAPDDYVHLNSIEVEPNGNLLVSGRNTRALYEVDRKTKKVLWRLGGKKSDFKMGDGTTFAWQHDARRQRDGTISVFDNGAAPPVEQFSRVLVLRLNIQAKQATLVRSYAHPKKLLVPFEGNAQFLPNGNVFVGWGAIPYFTEFARNGRVLMDASFGKGTAKITAPNQDADTYRAFRFVWHGYPTDKPAAAVSRGKLYVSWNGATEVTNWQLLSGSDDGSLSPGKTVPKRGFETAISLRGAKGPAFAARALDRKGHVLARSRVVQASGR
jgi:Arylsulfotransferase (ASST)